MRLFFAALISLAILAGCSNDSKFKKYNGPEVTQIYVDKSDRTMYLLHNKRVLKSYKFHLGFEPDGHKYFEGDGRTPEGVYRIDRANPNSNYHLSLGVSYPNTNDVVKAFSAGKSPGGDIFIHGGPVLLKDKNKPDWTAGCIAVTNEEIEEIYAMVNVGTLIVIRP